MDEWVLISEGPYQFSVALNMQGAYLYGAQLQGAILTSARLHAADLTAADLSGAIADFANLFAADLSRARLQGTQLDTASLQGANYDAADFRGASLGTAWIWRSDPERTRVGHNLGDSPYDIAVDAEYFTNIVREATEDVLTDETKGQVLEALAEIDPSKPDQERAAAQHFWRDVVKADGDQEDASFIADIACRSDGAPYIARGMLGLVSSDDGVVVGLRLADRARVSSAILARLSVGDCPGVSTNGDNPTSLLKVWAASEEAVAE